MGFMFHIFPLVFSIAFLCILGMIVATFIRGASQWRRNNQSPVLTVAAEIVSRRADTQQHSHMNDPGWNGPTHTASTTYYATFQVESGDRIELRIPGDQYGLLAEGDRGGLTFQGTRFLSFQRER